MAVLDDCKINAHSFLEERFSLSCDGLQEELFRHAERGGSDDEQRQYFEAMQLLKTSREKIATDFRAELNIRFERFISGEKIEPATDPAQSLDLVDTGILEDEIAVSVIVSKANNLSSDALWKLNRRLAAMNQGARLDDASNPFGPEQVVSAVRAAIQVLDLTRLTKSLVYKYIGQEFASQLVKLYQQLNDLLIAENILPNLKYSGNKCSAAASTSAASEAAVDDVAPAGDPSGGEEQAQAYKKVWEEAVHSELLKQSIVRQQQLCSAINEIQNTQLAAVFGDTVASLGQQGVSVSASVTERTFVPEDYLQVLSLLQSNGLTSTNTSEPANADAIESHFFEQLAKQSKEEQSRNEITRDDANKVDFVGMIFRYMLDDPYLPPQVKSTLSHLHTPYLKLALIDQTFLDDYRHPARVLLDVMADSGSKWVGDQADDPVAKKIRSVVDSIATGYAENIDVFAQLLDDFSNFISTLEKRASMVEKRNLEAEKGLEKLKLARHQATQCLAEKLSGHNTSAPLKHLLDNAWVDYLAFKALRHGVDSEPFQQGLTLVDDALWTLSDEAQAVDDSDYQAKLSTLATAFRDGLDSIGYDENTAQRLLDELVEAQIQLRRGANGVDLAEPSPSVDEDAVVECVNSSEALAQQSAIQRQLSEQQDENETEQPEDFYEASARSLSKVEKSIAERLESVSFGTWFDFHEADIDYSRRLKLAWFSSISRHYMFVNSAGVKQKVVPFNGLVEGMQNGLIEILEEENEFFLERAFKSILGRLRLKAAS